MLFIMFPCFQCHDIVLPQANHPLRPTYSDKSNFPCFLNFVHSHNCTVCRDMNDYCYKGYTVSCWVNECLSKSQVCDIGALIIFSYMKSDRKCSRERGMMCSKGPTLDSRTQPCLRDVLYQVHYGGTPSSSFLRSPI